MINLDEVKYNGYTAQVRVVDGKRCLRLQDLSHLSRVHFTSIYRVFNKNRYKLSQYVCDTKKRGTYLTLEGCLRFLKCFKFPDDGLISEIESKYMIKLEPAPKPFVERFVDSELSRLETENKMNSLKESIEEIKKQVCEVKEDKENKEDGGS